MKFFLKIVCMVLVSTRFSAVKADKAVDLVCNSVPTITIGVAACVIDDSCFCSTASIGANACIGVNACDFSNGPLGADACVGENACQNADATVGANSCIGENACQNADVPASIGAASCLGGNACIGVVATVGAGSCLSLSSSDSPCGESAGNIGAGSCIGADPCRSLLITATVGAGSCIGPGANCHCLGITIGALSCLGEGACIGVIEGNIGPPGSVGAGSCTNKGSCYRSTGGIAAGSCTGEDSCYKAGGGIAAGSCTGEGSCWGTTSTFSSAAGSCTGKNSCKCASKVFAAGSCTTEDSCIEECDGTVQEDTPAEAAIFCPSRFTETVAPTLSPVAPTLSPVAPTMSPTINTPSACPADVTIFHTDGITTVDPLQAVQILNQDTQNVTVRLNNAWTNTEEAIDKIFYTYKHNAFSQKCHDATDTLGSVNYDDITIHCHQTVAFAELDICVADNGGALVADFDTAEIPTCCGYFDGPTVCYKFKIYCESKCGDEEVLRRNLRNEVQRRNLRKNRISNRANNRQHQPTK
ncbi:hypothetical protein FRACYDRAFT_247980 [Fragilariopsis cylindrus CCMP1102]|uniref:Uncharacterized protein n=1 Tax=Fragilariopsis cylindrus CCMP1102 TaxID=635003 RepID=A0A1E7EV86_9STRA|nr:hypothetical protein FRACYDRAFT_247980 [Fragilariopsis cylindrus CCMP1102]|eukprot:OEU09724.1 hypothetical protein FRACYDRAFT_247980 [Fragilariopsis cylindrus CCMP1102]